jgi:hypothetical protein
MKTTDRELLDTSIAQLQALAAFLSDQLSDWVGRGPRASETNACEDILHVLRELILTHRGREERRV